MLQLIANGEYNYGAQADGVMDNATRDHSDLIERFDDACHTASKILGRSQDRESKVRIGTLLKTETRKRSLAIDARRFTNPIGLGVFAPGDEELYSRVTVTERFGRSMQQKPFHPVGFGSVAVKLFLFSPEQQEQEMHRAVCERTGDDIRTQIDSLRPSRGRDIGHVLQLLEFTQNSLR